MRKAVRQARSRSERRGVRLDMSATEDGAQMQAPVPEGIPHLARLISKRPMVLDRRSYITFPPAQVMWIHSRLLIHRAVDLPDFQE